MSYLEHFSTLRYRKFYWNSMGITRNLFQLPTSFESIKLQADLIFTKKKLIEIKGSNTHSVKDFHNQILQQMIRRRLNYETIGSQTRRLLWVQLSQYYSRPQFYNDLKEIQIAHEFQVTIQKDIRRTFKSFQVKTKAREVLQVFCHYNPYIGYCQGMNTIVAFLISKGFDTSQSFFIFKRITELLLPCDYYTNMENVMVYTRIFYEMLHIANPEVYFHLKKISGEMQTTYIMMVSFVLQWFVCLFCNDNVNQNITQIIWDFFLIQGISALFKAALAMFDLLREDILACNDFESYNMMQKERIPLVKDWKYVLERLRQTYISGKIIQLIKQKLLQPVQYGNKERSLQGQKSNRAERYKQNCQQNSNVCFQVLQEKLQQNKPFQIFVFKPKDKINIMPNYFDTINKKYFKTEKTKSKIDSLLIGRIPHICRNSSETFASQSVSDKNSTPNKTVGSTPWSQKTTPSKDNESKIRQKVFKKITQIGEKECKMARSDSIIFMEQMAKNASITDLLQIYDLDQLFE